MKTTKAGSLLRDKSVYDTVRTNISLVTEITYYVIVLVTAYYADQ